MVNQQEDMMQTARGPIEGLHRAGTFDMSTLRGVEAMGQHMAEFQTQFRLPEIREVQKFIHQHDESGTMAAIRSMPQVWEGQAAELQRTMETMRQPWLDTKNLMQSYTSFAELQGIGRALRTLPPFDDSLAKQLRADLGDWRTPLSLAPETLVDPFVRTELYLARGLNPTLTAFPANAFLESTTIADLRPPPPQIADAYSGERDKGSSDNEEDGLTRTNAAHDRLMRFETQVRRFVVDRMTAAFGPKWVKQHVPDAIWKKWDEKRQKAQDAGEPEWPLIAYADFTDYVTIITRKDNWEGAFSPVFKRQSLVQESFQRLYPIRVLRTTLI
jgi:hypothetical protein